MKYLIDTNILIYYFNGSMSLDVKNKISALLKEEFNISIITKMEFLGFNRFTKNEKVEAARFVSFSNLISLSDNIADKVILLKQMYRIKLPDAIIAATALCNNLKLATHNSNDFAGIDLELYDPF